MTIPAYEVNFDTLHGMHYCFEEGVANPRLAALQGLNKMKFIASLGIKQAVLPPQELPHFPTLRKLGFEGTVQDMLSTAKRLAPWLIPQVSKPVRIAATATPSIDSANTHLHFTPANLASSFQTSQETLSRVLQKIFNNPIYFEHHSPLPSSELFFDEGGINTFRFCKTYGSPGVQLFTFGKSLQPSQNLLTFPEINPAKQTKEAGEAISRLHRLYPGHALFAFQNSNTIDTGALYTLATANQNVLLIHQKALWKQGDILTQLKNAVADISGTELIIIEIPDKKLSVNEAITSSFFHSQIVTLNDNSMALIAASNCKSLETKNGFIKEILQDNDNPISALHYVDLSEILKNGGGPRFLGLQVVMNAAELAEIPETLFLTENLYSKLTAHVNQYYPGELRPHDLADPKLYQRSCDSLNEICKILNLRDIYSFQSI